VTGKLVHPQELERCAVTGKRALKKLLVQSSVTGARALEAEAVSSISGHYCLPSETIACEWAGGRHHPDDTHMCELTGFVHHVKFSANNRFKPLMALLDGTSRRADRPELWEAIASAHKASLGGRCTVESAELSPDGAKLAVVIEVKRMLGFRVEQAGLILNLEQRHLAGRSVLGQRANKQWIETKTVKAA
jgi:hypothetical protein